MALIKMVSWQGRADQGPKVAWEITVPNRSNVETSLHFILIPHARQHTAVDRPLSRMLLNALHKQSQDLFGSRAVILSYETASKTFHPLPYDTPQKVGTIFSSTV